MSVLRILWQRGPSTVRQVHTQLSEQRDVGYTTALKMLQIMHEKGIVERDDARRPHIYWPAQSKETVQSGLVTALARKAFGGSAARLVMRALSSRRTSSQELHEIRAFIDQIASESSEE